MTTDRTGEVLLGALRPNAWHLVHFGVLPESMNLARKWKGFITTYSETFASKSEAHVTYLELGKVNAGAIAVDRSGRVLQRKWGGAVSISRCNNTCTPRRRVFVPDRP